MLPEDRIRLQHMLDVCREAAGFVAGRRRADLDQDRMLLLALTKCIEILGEAANRVTDETRAMLPDIQWRSVIAMRNRLIHGYFDVDTDLVWKTVTDEMPELIRPLTRGLGDQ